MSFANGKLAKIWEIKPKENFTEVKISTSRKDQDGDYVQDFGSFVRFIGKANDKVRKLQGNENIKLLQVETTNRYDKSKAQMYTNYACFDFELYTSNGQTKKDNEQTHQTDNNDNTPPLYDSEPPLPFN